MRSMRIGACKLISPHDQLLSHFGRRLTLCHRGAISLLYVKYKPFWVFIYHAFHFQISFISFSFMYAPVHSAFYATQKFSSAISWHYIAKFNVPLPVSPLLQSAVWQRYIHRDEERERERDEQAKGHILQVEIKFWKWYTLAYLLTYCGQVTQICVFTLQLCKTDDANLRF